MTLKLLLERRDISSEVKEVIRKDLSEFEKERARLLYLLQSGPMIIYSCEPWGDYRTTFMTENVVKILGYDSKEFLYTPSFWINGIHPEDKRRIVSSFTEISKVGTYSDIYRFRHKDGTYRWMLEEANLIRDEQGNPKEVVGYWTDITTKKQAEEALRESEERYKRISEASFEGIVIHEKGKILDVNQVFIELFGYKYSEINEIDEYGLIIPKDREYVKKLIESGSEIPYETTGLKKDGTTLPIYVQAKTIPYHGKKVRVAAVRDLTSQKKVNVQIINERINFYNILNSTDDLIYIVNSKYEIEFTNAALEREFEPVNDKKCYEYFNDFDEPCYWCTLKRVIKGETVRRVKSLSKNQKTYDMIDTPFRNSDGNISSLVILRDISKQKQFYETLQENEELLTNIIESMSDGVFVLNRDYQYTYWNKAMEKISKTPRQKVIKSGKFPWEHFPHLIKEGVDKMIRKAMKGDIIQRKEIPYSLPKDGTTGYTSETFLPLMTEKGEIRGILGVVSDITERKKAEDELQYQANLLQNVSDAVISTDLEFNISSWNKAAEIIYGWREEEALGRNVGELTQIEYPYDEKENVINQFMSKGIWRGEIIQKRKDDTPVNILTSVSIVKDDKGKPITVLAINRDITERKKMGTNIKAK